MSVGVEGRAISSVCAGLGTFQLGTKTQSPEATWGDSSPVDPAGQWHLANNLGVFSFDLPDFLGSS